VLLSELFQILQFFIVLILAFLFVCNIVQSLRFSHTFIKHAKDKKYSKSDILYMRSLYSNIYECFHKYQIWRYSRLS
jgi:hypothetical protein